MHIINAKIKEPATYGRLLLAGAASALLVACIPVAPAAWHDFLFYRSFNLGIVYAIIIGFIFSMALERNKALIENISTELNKIRRIYHLAHHIAESNAKLRPWFAGIKKDIEGYLTFMGGHDLAEYADGNARFRRISYAVYALPKLGLDYPSELYAGLIQATADVTEARQNIREKINHRIGAFKWLVVLFVTLSFCSFVVLATSAAFGDRIVTWLFVLNVFLIVDLLFEYDGLRPSEMRALATYYLEDKDTLCETVVSGRGKTC